MRKSTILIITCLLLFTLAACRGAGGETSMTVQPLSISPTLATHTATPVATTIPSRSTTAEPAAPNLRSQTQETLPTQTEDSPTTPDTETTQPTENPSGPGASSPTSQATDCLEKVAYYGDVTIPDNTFFPQGEVFIKTWRFRNEGMCTLTPDYKLVFHSGEMMNAPLSIPIETTIAPGEVAELSIEMKAPSRGGPHQGNWEFESPAGGRFGTGSAGKDIFWVLINVRFLDQNDQPQPVADTLLPAPTPSGCSTQRDPSYENQVLSFINQARSSNGLNPFNLDAKLSASAQNHSTDMACNNFVDHAGSNGSTWYNRIRAQGYVFTSASENIYVGNPQFGGTPQGAYDWWMNSQVHRDNILDPKMTHIGVGYIFNASSDYGGYYTLNFARP